MRRKTTGLTNRGRTRNRGRCTVGQGTILFTIAWRTTSTLQPQFAAVNPEGALPNVLAIVNEDQMAGFLTFAQSLRGTSIRKTESRIQSSVTSRKGESAKTDSALTCTSGSTVAE